MSNCCDDKSCEVEALRAQHSRILKIVLAINAVMFVVEGSAGYLAHSSALMGDSLDMLGDSASYAISLYALGKGERWNGFAALLKGAAMALLGGLVFFEAVIKIIRPSLPIAETMGLIGTLALVANLVCLALLWKSRTDDLNMNSVWLCSRNDILVNFGVLGSALAVKLTLTRWPDILVGIIISIIILHSSFGILQRSYLRIRS